jgi:hypothetical protein
MVIGEQHNRLTGLCGLLATLDARPNLAYYNDHERHAHRGR